MFLVRPSTMDFVQTYLVDPWEASGALAFKISMSSKFVALLQKGLPFVLFYMYGWRQLQKLDLTIFKTHFPRLPF